MALSQDMTVARFWQEVVRDTGADVLIPIDFERFSIINRAVDDVAGQVYELFTGSYMKSGTLTIVTNSASLTSFRIRREAISRILVQSSSLTKSARAVSMDEYLGFRASAAQSRMEIVYTIEGDTMLLAKGPALASYGTTVTLHYPALPTQVTADSDKVDLPDGTTVAIAILRAKKILAERYQKPQQDYSQEFSTLLQNLYSAFNINLSEEEVKEKTKALS